MENSVMRHLDGSYEDQMNDVYNALDYNGVCRVRR